MKYVLMPWFTLYFLLLLPFFLLLFFFFFFPPLFFSLLFFPSFFSPPFFSSLLSFFRCEMQMFAFRHRGNQTELEIELTISHYQTDDRLHFQTTR